MIPWWFSKWIKGADRIWHRDKPLMASFPIKIFFPFPISQWRLLHHNGINFLRLQRMIEEQAFKGTPALTHSFMLCWNMYLPKQIIYHGPSSLNTLHKFVSKRARLNLLKSKMPHPPKYVILEISDSLIICILLDLPEPSYTFGSFYHCFGYMYKIY